VRAEDKFLERQGVALDLLDRLRKKLESTPERPDWGDVGSMSSDARKIHQILDPDAADSTESLP
jgi:hypothetical protein